MKLKAKTDDGKDMKLETLQDGEKKADLSGWLPKRKRGQPKTDQSRQN